ncbi:hypothetical protein IVB30_05155 [Bradyrhizobium sp. 200]|uniref:hypothetical protein n=1 Tax=Bradyrhizobium sp. 200 TaxID=2782665 RepID=UPI001FFEF6FC|nr:hypothetical protein [Bradyrhizobium sp. 200]UPJ50792.1 hypothetical protein IVB30_05155 [Bradyrhizobium sp. 200]
MKPAKPTSKRTVKRDRAEYRFRIDAYSPETIPMARLAEYMGELSRLLGEPNAVHFNRLEPGSTVLVSQVEHEAIPKVRARTNSVRRGEGPSEAARAFKQINKLLREDNAVGFLHDKKVSAVIIRFPGREEPEEKFPVVRQQGSIDGTVIRVGGQDETVPVWLEVEDKKLSGCVATRAVAKQLGSKLYEPVRLFGKGRWSRDNEGQWSLVEFKIESFEPLQEASLSTVLQELRSIPTEWTDASFDELTDLRHGTKRKPHGGH